MQTKQCLQCSRMFVPAARHQQYCGLSCRRRAERKRAAARDPQHAPSPLDGTATAQDGYFTTLTNPTVEQLAALRGVYDNAQLLGKWTNPSLLIGALPELPPELRHYVMQDSDGNNIFTI